MAKSKAPNVVIALETLHSAVPKYIDFVANIPDIFGQ